MKMAEGCAGAEIRWKRTGENAGEDFLSRRRASATSGGSAKLVAFGGDVATLRGDDDDDENSSSSSAAAKKLRANKRMLGERDHRPIRHSGVRSLLPPVFRHSIGEIKMLKEKHNRHHRRAEREKDGDRRTTRRRKTAVYETQKHGVPKNRSERTEKRRE